MTPAVASGPDFLLIGAALILGVAVSIGLWLGAQYVMLEKTPGRFVKTAALHGLLGASGLAVLVFALRGPPRGMRFGVAGFGPASGIILAATLAGGLAMLATHLLRRPTPMALLLGHTMLGILGYVLLGTYITMLQ